MCAQSDVSKNEYLLLDSFFNFQKFNREIDMKDKLVIKDRPSIERFNAG